MHLKLFQIFNITLKRDSQTSPNCKGICGITVSERNSVLGLS